MGFKVKRKSLPTWHNEYKSNSNEFVSAFAITTDTDNSAKYYKGTFGGKEFNYVTDMGVFTRRPDSGLFDINNESKLIYKGCALNFEGNLSTPYVIAGNTGWAELPNIYEGTVYDGADRTVIITREYSTDDQTFILKVTVDGVEDTIIQNAPPFIYFEMCAAGGGGAGGNGEHYYNTGDATKTYTGGGGGGGGGICGIFDFTSSSAQTNGFKIILGGSGGGGIVGNTGRDIHNGHDSLPSYICINRDNVFSGDRIVVNGGKGAIACIYTESDGIFLSTGGSYGITDSHPVELTIGSSGSYDIKTLDTNCNTYCLDKSIYVFNGISCSYGGDGTGWTTIYAEDGSASNSGSGGSGNAVWNKYTWGEDDTSETLKIISSNSGGSRGLYKYGGGGGGSSFLGKGGSGAYNEGTGESYTNIAVLATSSGTSDGYGGGGGGGSFGYKWVDTVVDGQSIKIGDYKVGWGAAGAPACLKLYWVPVRGLPIGFQIDGVVYEAEEGMTWEEWCDSEYNTAGYYTGSDGVYLDGAINNQVDGVLPTELIKNDTNYILFSIDP